MRFKKNLLAILLSILLLFDTVELYRLVDQGWPKYVKVGPGDVVQIVRAPFTWEDWLIALAIVALHVWVIYFFRRFRKSEQVRH